MCFVRIMPEVVTTVLLEIFIPDKVGNSVFCVQSFFKR